ncbi:helix-turn-helix domain-containing protein [Providencia huaxiensis]|uniref:Helix-turn-helix domain-containing protein n=1 Tax=Providencia huaxiensis TaxID=2027290 RepID=A0A8I2AMI0_9GAMM|nr:MULTISPECIES: helix-turn-helix domain-containing protein [Providencia]MBN6362215.1 helix-turn-helix domain-containing protein [Providencia huaxiensis]MBQ0267101.1 helix-turn-helix domain-containing protein [Providencia huaxiensis]MBQ0533513.1 helix-turn-helix domain-containing protein [Providencia huaxiensis]MBQ0587070.1 helix-turn-helix domain-containing protein [Providencia huaxiensis]MCG9535366.1 helix-turn-helix domain-containing protein [Providencia huaxiensis]
MSTLQGVNSVDIAVSILNYIAQNGGIARAADISKGCDISKSRLHKYLVSLCRTQMLYQDIQTSRYGLGRNLAFLANFVESEDSYIDTINNGLIQFRDEQNVSTGIATRLGKALSLIKYNRSFKNIEIDFLPNTPLPVVKSAAGLVYSAFDSQFGSNSYSQDEINKVIQQGYAIRYQPTEGIPGAQSIACPVFNSEGQLVAAAVTMGFIAENEMERLATLLIKQVSRLNL